MVFIGVPSGQSGETSRAGVGADAGCAAAAAGAVGAALAASQLAGRVSDGYSEDGRMPPRTPATRLARSRSRASRGTVTPIKRLPAMVFRVAAEIQTALRASTTLGVPGVLWLSFTSLRLEQAQGAGGAGALLTFQIDFTARI